MGGQGDRKAIQRYRETLATGFKASLLLCRIENVHSGYVRQASVSHRGGLMFRAEHRDWRTSYELRPTPVEKSSVVTG